MMGAEEMIAVIEERLTLFIGMDRPNVAFQVLAPREALPAALHLTSVAPHVLLHSSLYNYHRRSRHPPTATLLRQIRHGRRRSEFVNPRTPRGAGSR